MHVWNSPSFHSCRFNVKTDNAQKYFISVGSSIMCFLARLHCACGCVVLLFKCLSFVDRFEPLKCSYCLWIQFSRLSMGWLHCIVCFDYASVLSVDVTQFLVCCTVLFKKKNIFGELSITNFTFVRIKYVALSSLRNYNRRYCGLSDLHIGLKLEKWFRSSTELSRNLSFHCSI